MIEHSIPTTRTARYFTTGDPGSAQAWLLMHGYGELATDLLANFDHVQDYFLVAPEGLSRFYIDRHRRVGASWMTRDNRLGEIKDYQEFLNRVYEDSLADRKSVSALGFSQGAHTACRWASVAPRVEKLVLWGSGAPEDIPPARFSKAMKDCQVTLVAGTKDRLFTPADADNEQRRLAAIDIDVEVVSYDGGHMIQPDVLYRVMSG